MTRGREPFEALFDPRSVALIGASERPGSVGAVMLRNLTANGFAGTIELVNPKHDSLAGIKVYSDVAHLPETPELAVVAVPSDQVLPIVRGLVARGTSAAVIVTAGFAELGEAGATMQREIVAAADGRMRIVGPNCIGVISPWTALNASFTHLTPSTGSLAFVSQSGALVTAVLDWAQPRGIGFSKILSLGDMADVDFADALAYLAADEKTSAILLYIEGVTNGGSFITAATAASRRKPVVAVKAGRRSEGARAARSHTGVLAGSDVVYDAAFRRAGLLRVETLPAMFDTVETLALAQPQRGNRLLLLTNGGGPGVIATDALIARGGTLAQLSPQTIAALNALLPSTWSHGNPVDIIGDAPPSEYSRIFDVLLADATADALLVLCCPTALNDPIETARAVSESVTAARARGERRNVFTVWLGEKSAAPARARFTEPEIPTYETPEDAIEGFMQCVRYRALLDGLEREPEPPPFDVDEVAVGAVLDAAQAKGGTWLDASEVEQVLLAYGISAPRSRIVADVESAADAAAELAVPVALKLRSPDITHKSEAGGVALNVRGAVEAHAAAHAMLERVTSAFPKARIDGFLVQEMIVRSNAVELIVGCSRDSVFGPVVLFGHGGVAVEEINDTAIELAPLDITTARAQVARTRVAKLLGGYRHHPPADLDAVARILVAVGLLIARHPDIIELDINPLLADEHGAIALDTRIRPHRGARRRAANVTACRSDESRTPFGRERAGQDEASMRVRAERSAAHR